MFGAEETANVEALRWALAWIFQGSREFRVKRGRVWQGGERERDRDRGGPMRYL